MRWSVLAIGLLVPGLTEAQTLGPKHCKATAEIVGAAVEGRKTGKPAAAIRASLTTGKDAIKPPYTDTVGPLVDWVFTLDEGAMQTDVAGAYQTQCLTY